MLPFQTQPTPPETTALERLASIRHYIEEGAVRDFVRESSDILRTYIEARFGLRAPRLSTEEFLFEAEHSPHLDAEHRARLAEFLFRCDRVKFGLGDLDATRMMSLYSAAEDFIRATASTATAPASISTTPAVSGNAPSVSSPAADPAPETATRPAPRAEPVPTPESRAEVTPEPAKTEVAG
jgi:hypothetical protein